MYTAKQSAFYARATHHVPSLTAADVLLLLPFSFADEPPARKVRKLNVSTRARQVQKRPANGEPDPEPEPFFDPEDGSSSPLPTRHVKPSGEEVDMATVYEQVRC